MYPSRSRLTANYDKIRVTRFVSSRKLQQLLHPGKKHDVKNNFLYLSADNVPQIIIFWISIYDYFFKDKKKKFETF